MVSHRRTSRKQIEKRVPPPGETLDSAVSSIVEATGSAAGAITLWDSERRQSSHSSTYGLRPDDFERIKPLIDQTLPALDGAATGQALLPVDGDESRYQVGTASAPLRMFALPLRSEGRLVGLLCLFNPPEQTVQAVSTGGLQEVVVNPMEVVYQNAQLLQRLMEEKRWLEGVIRSSADAILIVDRECRVVGFNPAWERLTGLRVNEARGRPCGEVFPLRASTGADDYQIGHLMREAATDWERRNAVIPNVEMLLRRRDGSEVPVETSYAIVHDEGGASLGGVITVRDITARKEAEALQTTFMSVISHELQTPITIINGYAGLLSDQAGKVETAQLKQKLDVIKEESERLSRMVENLLSASRFQAGRLDVQQEPLRLAPLIHRIVQRMRSIGLRQTMTTRIPRDLPLVYADPERIHQVLTNLLENAVKYSPTGGAIRVSAAEGPKEVFVRIRDRGAGVAAADRERIFQPFSRLDSRLVREVKGAGLGLYICKAIVEAHGGRIWVEAPEGGGALLVFSLLRDDHVNSRQLASGETYRGEARISG
ncbi:MAG: PAS domain S-box protein [Chloroflexi bacterium]|nr:PAS domain S-box protein [Chloroflexota bacterium]